MQFFICKGIVSHDSESNFWLYGYANVMRGLESGGVGHSSRKEAGRPGQNRKGRRQPRGHGSNNPTRREDGGSEL
jgi:hypothetical protein